MSEGRDPEALALGVEALQRGDLEAARRWLEAAAQAVPHDATPFGYLGTLHGQRGEWNAAIAAFRRAVELSPNSAPLRYNLGLALERGGLTREGLTAYQQALTVDPTHASSLEAVQRLQFAPPAIPVPPAATPPPVAARSVPPAPAPGEVRIAKAVPGQEGGSAYPSAPPVRAPRSLWVVLAGIVAAVFVCGGIYAFLFFQEYRPTNTAVRNIVATKPPVEVPKTEPAALTALPAGPGILVCDPISQGVSGTELDFATGCGRWLQFAAGAQGEFGRTPMWSSLDDPCIVLDRPWLRISEAEVARVAGLTGVSHVAVGEARKQSGGLRLTYRIIDATSGRLVGTPLELQGTEASIRQALPGAARRLCAALGVPLPKLPPLKESPRALRAVGGAAIPLIHSSNEVRRKPLEATAGEGPLAAFLLLTHPSSQPVILRTKADVEAMQRGNLLNPDTRRVVQEHPLVLAAVARSTWEGQSASIARDLLPTIDRVLRRHPNNYVLNAARVYALRAAGKFPEAVLAGQQAVRCSPTNPDAWRSLGGTYHVWSDRVREGRTFDKMSDRVTKLSLAAYEEWVKTASHVVALQPESFINQIELSNAYLYASNEEKAFEAAQASVQIAPAHPNGYLTVLSVCLPQWYDRPEDAAATLRAAARVAHRSQWWAPEDRVSVATQGALCGQTQLARAVLKTRPEQAGVDSWLRATEGKRLR